MKLLNIINSAFHCVITYLKIKVFICISYNLFVCIFASCFVLGFFCILEFIFAPSTCKEKHWRMTFAVFTSVKIKISRHWNLSLLLPLFFLTYCYDTYFSKMCWICHNLNHSYIESTNHNFSADCYLWSLDK